MDLIAQQPYVKVHREVTSIAQRDVEYDRVIYLYKDKVVTQHREFLIQDVIDISYRETSRDMGLLYIHTNSGLFSYTVKTSTKNFIEAFEKNKHE